MKSKEEKKAITTREQKFKAMLVKKLITELFITQLK